MAIKRKALNVSAQPELFAKFSEVVAKDFKTRSGVLQECMRAYIELSERCHKAGVKRLPTLEFKGCEPTVDCQSLKKLADTRVLVPSRRELRRVK